MYKKILLMLLMLLCIVCASVADYTIDEKYNSEEKELTVEYYCTDRDEIIVSFGNDEVNVVWMNKKTGKLENLKCDDFKEWVKAENLEKELNIVSDSKIVDKGKKHAK